MLITGGSRGLGLVLARGFAQRGAGIRSDVGNLISTVENELGIIDILVNNAGTILVGPRRESEYGIV